MFFKRAIYMLEYNVLRNMFYVRDITDKEEWDGSLAYIFSRKSAKGKERRIEE